MGARKKEESAGYNRKLNNLGMKEKRIPEREKINKIREKS